MKISIMVILMVALAVSCANFGTFPFLSIFSFLVILIVTIVAAIVTSMGGQENPISLIIPIGFFIWVTIPLALTYFFDYEKFWSWLIVPVVLVIGSFILRKIRDHFGWY